MKSYKIKKRILMNRFKKILRGGIILTIWWPMIVVLVVLHSVKLLSEGLVWLNEKSLNTLDKIFLPLLNKFCNGLDKILNIKKND